MCMKLEIHWYTGIDILVRGLSEKVFDSQENIWSLPRFISGQTVLSGITVFIMLDLIGQLRDNMQIIMHSC